MSYFREDDTNEIIPSHVIELFLALICFYKQRKANTIIFQAQGTKVVNHGQLYIGQLFIH